MKLHIENKRAIVSGSTGGIGYAIAQGLLEAGVQVAITGRQQDRIDQALASLRTAVPGCQVDGFAADLGTAAGTHALIAAFPETDILINNLGIFEWKPFFEIPDEDWERMFQVNVMSGVRLSRHYASGMVARGWGRIQFVSSESAIQTPGDMVHYGFSKTAQLAVSRGLAEVLAGTGVTVNALLPGPTRTTGADEFFEQLGAEQGTTAEAAEAGFIARNRPSSLIRRLARPEEVAHMSVFLASNLAAVTTGAAVHVDGGIVRSII